MSLSELGSSLPWAWGDLGVPGWCPQRGHMAGSGSAATAFLSISNFCKEHPWLKSFTGHPEKHCGSPVTWLQGCLVYSTCITSVMFLEANCDSEGLFFFGCSLCQNQDIMSKRWHVKTVVLKSDSKNCFKPVVEILNPTTLFFFQAQVLTDPKGSARNHKSIFLCNSQMFSIVSYLFIPVRIIWLNPKQSHFYQNIFCIF